MKLIHSLFALALALLFSVSAFADDLVAPNDPERSGFSSSRLPGAVLNPGPLQQEGAKID